MTALFTKLEADGQITNSAGCSRPKNPFINGLNVKPLTRESASAEELETTPTIENIVNWTTFE